MGQLSADRKARQRIGSLIQIAGGEFDLDE
jgi:hypothetical protein